MLLKKKKQADKQHYTGRNFQIWNKEALTILKELPENSVDCIIVDGPYNLSFQGNDWDSFKVEKSSKSAGGFGKNSKTNENQFAAARIRYSTDYVSNLAFQEWNAIWAKEAIKVLKPGGYLLAFGCTKTEHRLCSGIEDAGFEIRDKLTWLYSTGSPKGVGLKLEHAGKHTGLSPAQEFICVARKPLSEKTVQENVIRWGTGAYNIESCRLPRENSDQPGWYKTGANGSAGYRGSSTFRIRAMGAEEIRNRCGGKGRWPKNVLFTHSENCTEKRCMAGCSIRELENQRKAAARFFYVAKSAKRERDKGLDSLEEKEWIQYQTANGTSGKASSLSAGRNTTRRNNHPTPKPVTLMRYLVRLVCPENGLVLDHFMGSGTTGVAAILEGRNFIGVDNNSEYFLYAKLRLIDAEKDIALQARKAR